MTIKMKRQATYKLLTVALCSALLIVGCQKDDKDKVSVKLPSSGILSFGISQNDSWSSPSTKAEGQPQTKGSSFRSEMLLMDCEDADSPLGDVYIYMVEEEIPAAEPQEEVATRAEGSDPAEGKSAVVDSRTYGVFAYQGKGAAPETYVASDDVEEFTDIQNLLIDATGKYEGQDEGREIYAPGAGSWLYFYAYGPYMTLPAADDANPALRENGKYPYYEYTATHELAKTTDLLFGGSSAPQSGEVNDPIALSVSHILSKVRVNTGSIGSGRITSIALKGIHNAGTFNIDNNRVWELDNTKKTDYIETAATGNVEFDDIFLLPQALPNDATIEIKVLIETPELGRSTEYTLTKNLSAFLSEWQANKQYTYTISTPNEVEVHVSDEIVMEGTCPVKKNLVIKNCGLADAYIRVAIAGAWVVEEGTGTDAVQYTVSDWKNTGDSAKDDGIFDWGAAQPAKNITNTRHWRLGDDGYYYYMKSVVPGETIEPLFDSYKLTASSPVGGAYLAFTIIAQGIYLADAQHLFPDDIWTELSK